jgi:hypothetical protein
MTAFERELMPQLLSVFRQVGVKEIHHNGWRFYADAFPDIRFVLTARDPRDIFISTYHRVLEGKDRFRRGFTARVLAQNLNREFKQQRIMSETQHCFKLRYEDFCADQGRIDDVKAFVGSHLDGLGRVGQFNAANPRRALEAELHGGVITRTRVERWKQEADQEVVREAHLMFDLMPEFVEFWKYER